MKIESNIPAPGLINPGLTDAMRSMNVGDSILVRTPCAVHAVAKKVGISVRSRKTDKPFESRVWRVG